MRRSSSMRPGLANRAAGGTFACHAALARPSLTPAPARDGRGLGARLPGGAHALLRPRRVGNVAGRVRPREVLLALVHGVAGEEGPPAGVPGGGVSAADVGALPGHSAAELDGTVA